MAQPEFVPVLPVDDVRAGEIIPPASRWKATRPGDVVDGARASGAGFGSPGPDQGYALSLAKRFADRLVLSAGEHATDAVAGCLGVATKRSSLFGRGPVIHDLDLAFSVWGFLGDAPDDLVAYRRPLFAEAGHHYWKRRAIADAVPEATLRLVPAAVRAALATWRTLLVAP